MVSIRDPQRPDDSRRPAALPLSTEDLRAEVEGSAFSATWGRPPSLVALFGDFFLKGVQYWQGCVVLGAVGGFLRADDVGEGSNL